MATKRTTLTIEVEFDPAATSAENIAITLDAVLQDAYGACFEDLHSAPVFNGFRFPPAQDPLPPASVGKDAESLFNQVTGASYYGFHFREVLMENPEARAAARKLAECLKAAGVKGMD